MCLSCLTFFSIEITQILNILAARRIFNPDLSLAQDNEINMETVHELLSKDT